MGIGLEIEPRRQRLDLRGEGEALLVLEVIEGLGPEAVPRQDQLAGGRVQEPEGEHAVQARQQALWTLVDHGLEQHFRIAAGPKGNAATFQFGPELAEIVDLAVEHQDVAATLVPHRLMTALIEVDQREPGMGQPKAVTNEAPLGVGPSVQERVHRSLELGLTDAGSPTRPLVEHPENSAHDGVPLPTFGRVPFGLERIAPNAPFAGSRSSSSARPGPTRPTSGRGPRPKSRRLRNRGAGPNPRRSPRARR